MRYVLCHSRGYIHYININININIFMTSNFIVSQRSSVGKWLGCSLAVLGVVGSSLHTTSQRYDGMNSPYA